MRNLAIIPARGGSKRIPRKNIKDFLGKPIIAYSIETALGSGLFEEVMISTDDEEIAKVAKKYGAKVPFMRSEKNASDFAATVDVVLEVVQSYNEKGKSFDNLCCIYPTAPFVTISELKQGLEFLGEATSCLPIVEFGFPILRAFQVDDNKKIQYAWPEHEKSRSQDLEQFYHDAGQWYWVKTNVLVSEETLITSYSKPVFKNRLEVQDIDTEQDWQLAEIKYRLASE